MKQDFPSGTVDKNLPASAGGMGSIPGLRRCHMLESNSAHAPQLLSPWARTCTPQLQRSMCLEPVLCNKRSHCNKKPAHCNEEWPWLAATRESPHKAMKTQHSQNKQKKLIKLFFKKSECSRHSLSHRANCLKLFTRLTLLRVPKPRAPHRFCHHYWHQMFARRELYARWPFQELQKHFTCIRSVSRHALFSAMRSQGGPILLNVLINMLGPMKWAVHCARPCIRQCIHILSFNAHALPGS